MKYYLITKIEGYDVNAVGLVLSLQDAEDYVSQVLDGERYRGIENGVVYYHSETDFAVYQVELISVLENTSNYKVYY